MQQGSPATTPILVRDLVAGYGGRIALRGVSVRIESGQLAVLLGTNGSGKSTLLKAMVGLVPARSGEVHLHGIAVRKFRAWARVGYVPQRSTATAGVPATVAEVVAAGRLARSGWARPRTGADRAAVHAALEIVGLAERAKDPVGALSGGQQQRVLIARALAGEPDLLLMDEPMAGVDLEQQEAFAATLSTLKAAGRTVVVVAHELGALAPLIDHTVVLRAGQVVHDGPGVPAEHLHDHTHLHHHAPDPRRGVGGPVRMEWF